MEKQDLESENQRYLLILYIAGQTVRAEELKQLVTAYLDDALGNGYVLRVVDLLKNPEFAEDDKVFATPTLLKVLPEPGKRIMGDLSNKTSCLSHLGVIEKKS